VIYSDDQSKPYPGHTAQLTPPKACQFELSCGIVNILHFDCECYAEMKPHTRYRVNTIKKEGINLVIDVIDQ